jgi:asparaginyl-tRNA synthetase
VRAFRNNQFIALHDGSDAGTLQIVVDPEKIAATITRRIGFHACIMVTGSFQSSQGAGQQFEILADTVEILGDNDLEKYPLQPKRQTMEFLRQKAHFRMRTHAPIITGSDAEGAGEMFRVTMLSPDKPPLNEEGKVDFSKDFFGKATNLTVSGQLQGEIAALALGKIYTFGPTFRAENSNTPRHLAEFWMIEPEMAFYDIIDNMDLAEAFCKYLIAYVLEHNATDLAFLDQRLKEEEKSLPADKRRELGLLEQLEFVVNNDFVRITYDEAVAILMQSKPYKKGQFEFPVEWGRDLQAEHERYLVEKEFKKPVIVRNYPKDIKAFYMRMNDDDRTVAAMDVLFPGIGEVIGGSQREERESVLIDRMEKSGIHPEEMDWYLDLRRFGGAPHSGFGLGFERMVQFITGMGNIRDVIPFPRTPGNAEF